MDWKGDVLVLCLGILIMAGIASAGEAMNGADRAAVMLFSSEPMDASTGISVAGYYVGEDFEVSVGADATTVSFDLGDWNGDFPGVFDGLIRWWIYYDIGVRETPDHRRAETDAFPGAGEDRVGGSPGQLLARGTAYDISYSVTTPPGPSVYTSCYKVDFNLGQQVSLATATRYWLVLNVNQGLASGEFYSWIKSESDFFNHACFSDGGTGGWTHSSIDLSFSLSANTEVQYLFADEFETGDTAIWSFSTN